MEGTDAMVADAPPDLARLRQRVVGHRLPGGSFEIADYERWLGHDAMLAPALPPGVLHPVWILLGALRGMGVSTEELIGLAEATPADGVLFGETTMEQHTPLRSGVPYRVTGAVTGLDRRAGRRAGTMDVLTFELSLTDPDGALAAVSTQAFLIMRAGGTRPGGAAG